jgi:hypothetical protein
MIQSDLLLINPPHVFSTRKIAFNEVVPENWTLT